MRTIKRQGKERTYICIYEYMYTYTCIYIYICVCIDILIYIYVYTYIHVYVYIHKYICICIYLFSAGVWVPTQERNTPTHPPTPMHTQTCSHLPHKPCVHTRNIISHSLTHTSTQLHSYARTHTHRVKLTYLHNVPKPKLKSVLLVANVCL